jgi:hypothetical protein
MNTLLSNSALSIRPQPYSGAFPSVIFFGRTFAEYSAFFNLEPARDLHGCKILDCSAGFASFAFETRSQGAEVIAADPMYGRATSALAALGAAEITQVMRTARAHACKFTFSTFRDFDHAENCRRAALAGFLNDYASGFATGRYVRAELPELPFADDTFDLALNGHFLFLYAARLGETFLSQSLRELARVAREVRLFPLVDLDGRDYGQELEFLQSLAGSRLRTEIVPVHYEFLKGATSMLRVTRT